MESPDATADGTTAGSSLDDLLGRWRSPLRHLTPSRKPGKWRREGLRHWWFHVKCTTEPVEASHLASSEALALLEVMRRVDAKQVKRFLSAQTTRHQRADPVAARALSNVTDERIAFGLQFSVSVDDFGPISERVFAVRPPSSAFVNDYAYLRRLSGCGVDIGAKQSTRGIPVSLRIEMGDADPQALAFVLRQVLQLVMAQQGLHAQDTQDRQDAKALAKAASRFHIVEVGFGLPHAGLTAINGEALQYLAQLCQRGIRTRDLPSILDDEDSPSSRVAIAEALQVLISPFRDIGFEWCRPKHIYVSGDSSAHVVPMIFSAVQTSSCVKCVHLQARVQNPSSGPTPQLQITRRAIWVWSAYALFSRHAQHEVKRVDIDGNFLDDNEIEIVREVLVADDPVDVLFRANAGQHRQRGWLSASTFYASPPSTDGSRSDAFEQKAAVAVRAIASVERFGEKWWKVLLPGQGEAWVADRDAQEHESRDVLLETRPKGLHIKFFDNTESDQEDVATLLRLIHGEVTGFELDSPDYEFDVDEWVPQVISSCPALHTLIFASKAELNGLGGIVERVSSGECRLRRLEVDSVQDVDSTDAIAFLGFLCDETHPLTKTLEVLKLPVAIEDDSTQDFALDVRRLLACNRRIHTLSLTVYASEFDMPEDGPVAIRLGPLDLRSKLAFISVASELPSGGTLDSSAMSIIFSFAAQHRLREVDIELSSLHRVDRRRRRDFRRPAQLS